MNSTESFFENVSNYFRGVGNIESLLLTTFGLDTEYLETSILSAFFPHLGEGPANEPHRPLLSYLEDNPVPISVLYDANNLSLGGRNSGFVKKNLRWQAHPIFRSTGCFHPKLVLALVNKSGERSIVVGCSSANLTKSGWGRNFEACAFKTIKLKGDDNNHLLFDTYALVGQLVQQCTDSEALRIINETLSEFLDNEKPDRKTTRVFGGRYRSRLWFGFNHAYANRDQNAKSLTEMLRKEVLKGDLKRNDWRLEIISPYYSNEPPELVKWFDSILTKRELSEPHSLLCYCPRDGEYIDLDPQVLESYKTLKSVYWADIIGNSLKSRFRDENGNALQRFLHAKVYRFWNDTNELVIVGSANATTHGHRDGGRGNDECCLIFSNKQVGTEKFQPWLVAYDNELDISKCRQSEHELDDEGASRSIPKVSVSFDWSTRIMEITNLDSSDVSVLLGLRFLSCVAQEKYFTTKLEDEDIGSLIRSPSVSVSYIGEEISHTLLIEESNLYAKPPAHTMQLTVDDLISDWQLDPTKRLVKNNNRATMYDELQTISGNTSSDIDENIIPDRLNELFLATHHFQKDIENKLQILNKNNDQKDGCSRTYLRTQIQFRMFGNGAMSIRYFIDVLFDQLNIHVSNDLNSLQPVEAYLAVLSIVDVVEQLESPIKLANFQEEWVELLQELKKRQEELRMEIKSTLEEELDKDNANSVIDWVEANWRFERFDKTGVR